MCVCVCVCVCVQHTCIYMYLGIRGGQPFLQHRDNLRQDPLSELPNKVTERSSGHLALVRVLATEERQQESNKRGKDLAQRAGGVSHDHLPHVEGRLAHHQCHVGSAVVYIHSAASSSGHLGTRHTYLPLLRACPLFRRIYKHSYN